MLFCHFVKQLDITEKLNSHLVTDNFVSINHLHYDAVLFYLVMLS